MRASRAEATSGAAAGTERDPDVACERKAHAAQAATRILGSRRPHHAPYLPPLLADHGEADGDAEELGVIDVAADDRLDAGFDQAREHQQEPGEDEQASLDERGLAQRPALRAGGKCNDAERGLYRDLNDVDDRAVLGDLEEEADPLRVEHEDEWQ